MTKIAIIGATGKLGSLLCEKSLKRGNEVSAIVRDRSKLEVKLAEENIIERNLYDLTREDLESYDVVFNAFNAPFDDPNQFVTSLEHLAKILSGTNVHLIVAGGAGALYLDKEKGIRLVDSPDLPEAFKPIAVAEVKAYDQLKNDNSFKWTYMTPPADLDYGGAHTGKYKYAGDLLMVNSEGKSYLSYEDYADAMIDQIGRDDNSHQLIGVVSE